VVNLQTNQVSGGQAQGDVISGFSNVTGSGLADALSGSSGTNRLDGGAGNDTLVGNGGYDTYVLSRGSGQDVVQNATGNSAANGELDLGAGIATNQVWLVHSGNDLVVEIMGTSDRTTISGWYASGAAQLQHIVTSGGQMLDAQLQTLVGQMAAFQAGHPGFDPTAAANTQVTDPTLQSQIAAAWH